MKWDNNLFRELKKMKAKNVNTSIDTWECIECGIETNYSSDGDCIWCNKMKDYESQISVLKTWILQLEEMRRVAVE